MAMSGRPRSTASDGDRRLDRRMRVVTFDGDILELEREEAIRRDGAKGPTVFQLRVDDRPHGHRGPPVFEPASR